MSLSNTGFAPQSGNAGFLGVLESPLGHGQPLLGERVEVRGWALADVEVDRIRMRLGHGPVVELTTGHERADVADAFSGYRQASRSGFSGWLDLRDYPTGQHQLQVAVDCGGRTIHEWRRTLDITELNVCYRAWRARVDLQTPPPRPADTPRVTWLVPVLEPQLRADAERAADRLRFQGKGTWLVVVVEARSDGRLPPLTAIETPYVGWILPTDQLAHEAAAWLTAGLAEEPGTDLVYFDHDHLARDGGGSDPVFKPGWSILLATHPEVAESGWLARRALFPCSTWVPAEIVAACRSGWHLPRPLLRLGSRPSTTQESVNAAMPKQAMESLSVVIPTRMADQGRLARCLDGLRRSPYGNEPQVIVVLNNLGPVTEAEAHAFLAPWRVESLYLEGKFNWSRLNNHGASQARGAWLLFLNDDVEPLRESWLAALWQLAQRPGIGAAGAVLRYPNGSIQHAGIYVNAGARPECRHSFRHCTGDEPRVRRWLSHDRAQTAVTGACLLTPRVLFEAVGGFEETLPLVFNDVDYCLRLRDRGYLSAVAAGAQLKHEEGSSRSGMIEADDRLIFDARWASSLPQVDPFSHPGLIRDRDDWMFDPTRLPSADPLSR